MKNVCGYDWGADKLSLLNIYRALIRSTIDYGCTVYGKACETILQRLDRVQNRALRLSLWTMRTTPINPVLAEACELPLHLRRDKLSVACWV